MTKYELITKSLEDFGQRRISIYAFTKFIRTYASLKNINVEFCILEILNSPAINLVTYAKEFQSKSTVLFYDCVKVALEELAREVDRKGLKML